MADSLAVTRDYDCTCEIYPPTGGLVRDAGCPAHRTPETMDMRRLRFCPRIIEGRWYWPVWRHGKVVAIAPEATHPDFSTGVARGFCHGDYWDNPQRPAICLCEPFPILRGIRRGGCPFHPDK